MCIICMQQISFVNEYSIHRHYDNHNIHKFRNLQGNANKDKVKELFSGLEKQQSICSHSMEVRYAAI